MPLSKIKVHNAANDLIKKYNFSDAVEFALRRQLESSEKEELDQARFWHQVTEAIHTLQKNI